MLSDRNRNCDRILDFWPSDDLKWVTEMVVNVGELIQLLKELRTLQQLAQTQLEAVEFWLRRYSHMMTGSGRNEAKLKLFSRKCLEFSDALLHVVKLGSSRPPSI